MCSVQKPIVVFFPANETSHWHAHSPYELTLCAKLSNGSFTSVLYSKRKFKMRALNSSVFWVVTQRKLILNTDVSRQPVCSIFKGKCLGLTWLATMPVCVNLMKRGFVISGACMVTSCGRENLLGYVELQMNALSVDYNLLFFLICRFQWWRVLRLSLLRMLCVVR